MKLIQINKKMKCQVCKKYYLEKTHGGRMMSNNTAIMWDYSCSNCGAKFIEGKDD